MEQVIYLVGIFLFLVGGFAGMLIIWIPVEIVVMDKYDFRKGWIISIYALYVCIYFLFVHHLTISLLGESFITPIMGGIYGASVGSKLKELKKKKRRYSY
ncbi:hypothetical protein CVD28_03330 [Bacillus sp. M6-12]|uniref:hypothetical protein n=1 Tax=Bacillus sp. M6-12 TaxID=2054166 RepID=UPI000C75C957|nr:hypothetical protein [Bacillus sp. M6-12]PLS19462.1 hypothetical protein CVD28_03330 [Bacillus sp. M6-12]